MDLFKLPGVKADTRVIVGGHAIEIVRMSFHTVESRLHQFKELLMIHIAGRTQHNSVWMVTTVQVFENLLPVKGPYRLDVTEDRTSQRIPFPKSPIKEYVDILIGRIFHHLYFLQDYLSLALYFPLVEYGMEEDIGKYVYNQG